MDLNKECNNVFIIDDDPQVLKSYEYLFQSIQCNVLVFDNPENFLKIYHSKTTGCLITDIFMPSMNGIELLEKLALSNDRLKVICITGYGSIPMAVQAMKAGASDFLVKPVLHNTLIDITLKYLQEIAKKMISPMSQVSEALANLTKREKEVMDLVIMGKLNKQIASELNISMSTVEAHRAQVMRKMNVKTLADLIKVNLMATQCV